MLGTKITGDEMSVGLKVRDQSFGTKFPVDEMSCNPFVCVCWSHFVSFHIKKEPSLERTERRRRARARKSRSCNPKVSIKKRSIDRSATLRGKTKGGSINANPTKKKVGTHLKSVEKTGERETRNADRSWLYF